MPKEMPLLVTLSIWLLEKSLTVTDVMTFPCMGKTWNNQIRQTIILRLHCTGLGKWNGSQLSIQCLK